MILTDPEKAFLRRMMYETVHNLFGPGTVFAENATQDHQRYDALVSLATPEIQRELDWWDPATTYVPPEVPFPWPSTEALHQRAEQSRLEQEALRHDRS